VYRLLVGKPKGKRSLGRPVMTSGIGTYMTEFAPLFYSVSDTH
jgi:hypothetical protein